MWDRFKDAWARIRSLAKNHPFWAAIAGANVVTFASLYVVAYCLTSLPAAQREIVVDALRAIGLGKTADMQELRKHVFDQKIDTTYGRYFLLTKGDVVT